MIKPVFGPIASVKSRRWVRLVVPTSRSRQPERAMISGSRNAPPISISSPREVGTSRFLARLLSTSSKAAALLLTTVAACAPVKRASRVSTWSSRSPRVPACRSNSRLLAPPATDSMASNASCGKAARPKLVCRTRAGQVEYAPERGTGLLRKDRCRLPQHAIEAAGAGARPGHDLAPAFQFVPQRSKNRLAAVGFDQRDAACIAQQAIHRRQG